MIDQTYSVILKYTYGSISSHKDCFGEVFEVASLYPYPRTRRSVDSGGGGRETNRRRRGKVSASWKKRASGYQLIQSLKPRFVRSFSCSWIKFVLGPQFLAVLFPLPRQLLGVGRGFSEALSFSKKKVLKISNLVHRKQPVFFKESCVNSLSRSRSF